MSSTGAKGSHQTNTKTEKGFKYREQMSAEVCPGLAHRTVRCATGQCPVHQGLQFRTAHLREFWRPLRYNSPDCPVCQRSNDYFTPTVVCRTHWMGYSARQSQSRDWWRTGQWTVPVRCTTGLSGAPEDRSSNGQNPTTRWCGRRTGQCPVAHRTVRCAMRQTASQRPLLVVGAINTPTTPPFIVSKFSNFPHLTRAIAFNTRHTKEIKSSQVLSSF
jgi:hypothetical protein